MDLIIVDENIKYTKSLREFCIKSSNFKNVIIFRNIKELLDTYLPQKGILLFELNENNTKSLKKINSENSGLILVGLTNEKQIKTNFKSSFENISSFISKSEKLDEILEQIILIIKGKRIIPQEIFEEIKSLSTIKIQKTTKHKISNVFTKLFL